MERWRDGEMEKRRDGETRTQLLPRLFGNEYSYGLDSNSLSSTDLTVFANLTFPEKQKLKNIYQT